MALLEGTSCGAKRIAQLALTPKAKLMYHFGFYEFAGEIMFAVIKTGGKQYRVADGEKLKIEKIAAEIGAEVVLDKVLALGEGESVRIGSPLVDGVTIKATVLRHGLGDKIKIYKHRRRKHYEKHQGHRQRFTEIQISGIDS